ncbi:MAG: T9SS type A sorting domain-containing protein [Candidatus Kapabacteria bacterium]|nr:T9SS type A sorting domain-containing protein [Candidatus Kapabacteria bacterium]
MTERYSIGAFSRAFMCVVCFCFLAHGQVFGQRKVVKVDSAEKLTYVQYEIPDVDGDGEKDTFQIKRWLTEYGERSVVPHALVWSGKEQDTTLLEFGKKSSRSYRMKIDDVNRDGTMELVLIEGTRSEKRQQKARDTIQERTNEIDRTRRARIIELSAGLRKQKSISIDDDKPRGKNADFVDDVDLFTGDQHVDVGLSGLRVYRAHPPELQREPIRQESLDEEGSPSLRLAPNPATSILGVDIDSPAAPTMVEIVDLTGNVVLTIDGGGVSRSMSIPVASLAVGQYTLRVRCADGGVLSRIFVRGAGR